VPRGAGETRVTSYTTGANRATAKMPQ
jgi:hypothetical protein